MMRRFVEDSREEGCSICDFYPGVCGHTNSRADRSGLTVDTLVNETSGCYWLY